MTEIIISHDDFVHKRPVMLDFIAHWLDVYNNSKLAPYGITHSQAKILVRLSHCEGGRMPQGELKNIGRRGSTITSTLSNLEKGGFIRRTQSEDDARAKFIEITDKGRAVQQVALQNILELDELIADLLDKSEAEELQHLLVKLSDGIKEKYCQRKD